MYLRMELRRIFNTILTCAYLGGLVAGQNKINVPRVLLPRATDVATNFTLKITDGGGCFQWWSTRPDVASVTAISDGVSEGTSCSSTAVVTALSRSDSRLTSIIWAEHQTERFRCDVIVDTIHSLEIVTTTLELFLEDAPEAFGIKAKDDKGDTFTSLDGLDFEWKIENDIRNSSAFMDGHSILRLTKFSDTQYKPPTSVFTLEAQGKRGYMVLVEGLQTGSAIVTAALKNSVFRFVEPASVRLVVVANLVLQPPHDIYLMQYGVIQYRVQQIKQARSFDIVMPSLQYYLEVENTEICSLDSGASQVSCTKLGDTQIVLKDRHMKETDAHHPSAVIHIVQPAYVSLVVLPGRNWVLQRGVDYEVIAELYDRESHLIYPSSNLHIRVDFAADYFNKLYVTLNGSHSHIQTKKTGRTEVTMELHAVTLTDGTVHKFPRAIAKVQPVEINDPVNVTPKLLLFPYDIAASRLYQTTLTAQGGSGNFTWSSSDLTVVTVDRYTGQIKTGGNYSGSAVVSAFDIKNPTHMDKTEIHIVPVFDLVLLPTVLEVEVNHTLHLPVALRGKIPGSQTPHIFSDCRNLVLKTVLSEGTVFELLPELTTDKLVDESCAFVSAKATKAGFSGLVVSYTSPSGEVISSPQTTIAAFNPLRVVESSDMTVLTVGSSRMFHFEGGPAPWIHEPAGHRVILVEKHRGVITNRTVGGSGASILKEVACLKLGDEHITLEVSNNPSKTLRLPAVAKTTVHVVCAPPARIEIVPRVERHLSHHLPACPWSKDSNDPFPVLRNTDLLLDIRVFDHLDQPFYNFSSLHFYWEVNDAKILGLHETDGFSFPWHRDGGELSGRGINHKLITVHDSEGRAKISLHVNSYHKEALHLVKSHEHAKLAVPLHASTDVILVQEPVFDKRSVVVFNNPNNREVVHISEGSGYFHLIASNSQLARIAFDRKARSLSLYPVMDGDLVVTAYDVCTNAKPAELQVTVSGLNHVEILVADKVEIGTSIQLLVRVYDSARQLVPTRYYSLMNIVPMASSDLITLKEEAGQVPESHRIFSVYGNLLGRVTVFFKGTRSDLTEVASKSADIQVFPPLRLEPKNVTLVKTGRFQLTAQGGPQPQGSVLFVSRKGSIVSVDAQSGLSEGLTIGNTVVLAQIVDVDPVSGKEMIYSQDVAEVYVLPYSGVKIHTPLRIMEIGSEIPLLAMGTNENETPFTFGSATPAFQFLWSADNMDVVDLRSVYHPYKVSVIPENNFAMRLAARSQGSVTVRLNVSGPSPAKKSTCQVLIRVVDTLRLIGNLGCQGQSVIRITPNTKATIKTSRDGEAKLSYRVVEGDNLVQIDSLGLLSTGSRIGTAVVSVEAGENEFFRTLFITVEVKDTSYLKINANSQLRSDDVLESLPLSVPIRFTVSFHDDLGRDFFATNTQLKYRTNRNDLVSVSWTPDNGTLIAKSLQPGSTILKVWDSARPSLYDFVNIQVAPVISPHGYEAHVGEIVCFRCPLITEDGHRGRWSSSGFNVYINQDTGTAIATAPGKATILYNVSSNAVSKSVINVKPLSGLSLVAQHGERYLTNAPAKTTPVTIPVVLGKATSSSCPEFETAAFVEVAHRLWDIERDLFECSLAFDRQHPAGIAVEDLFNVHADVDADTGQFVCLIHAKSSTRHHDEALSNFTAAVQLTARPARYAATQEPDVLKIAFYPAFHVLTPEIHLNHVQLETVLMISATPAVQRCLQVRSSEVNIVEVGAPVLDRKLDHWAYPIKLIYDPTLHVRVAGIYPQINVDCFKTDQHVAVPVKIRLTADVGRTTGSFISPNNYSWDWVGPALIVTLVVAFLWTIWLVWQQKEQDRQYYQYLAATGQVPPNRSSRSLNNSSSSSPRRPVSGSLSRLGNSLMGTPDGTWRTDDDVNRSVADDHISGGPKLWSTNRNIGISDNMLFRRSPK